MTPMRSWVLVALVSIASAGEETDRRLEGDWGLAKFLSPSGISMWIGFGAGSKVRIETTTASPIAPDYFRRTKEPLEKTLDVTKLVKTERDLLVLEHQRLKFSKKGKKGKWGKKSKTNHALTAVEWKVEKLGDTIYSLRAKALKAQDLRVTAMFKSSGERQVWRVTANEQYGVLAAVRTEPTGLQWHLRRVDVEAKVGKRTLKCREYEYTYDLPAQLNPIFAQSPDKTLLLCEEVPGYIVSAKYRGILRASVVEKLVSFKATKRR
jgi:hypothetical protein